MYQVLLKQFFSVLQESLTSALKHQIGAEIRSLPDLCQSLGNLDVSISFLKSVGGDPEQNLHGFMSETLKMENPLLSQKVTSYSYSQCPKMCTSAC